MEQELHLLNGLALAYVGDAAYEIAVRMHLVKQGFTKPNDLHRRATNYVSAKAQAGIMYQLLEQDFLREEEQAAYKRGRNAKSHTIAKNADVTTYRVATGFEAVLGFLTVTNQSERLDEVISKSIQLVEEDQHEKT